MVFTIKKIIIEGHIKSIEAAVHNALNEGLSPDEIVDAMAEAMDVVGDQFQKNEIFVPEMLVAAKTMQRGVGVLAPLLSASDAAEKETFIIGTVAGDLHDIGKNLVAMMIETAGFNVIDLGVDVPVETFLQALRDHPECKMVGLSALLTITMDSMRTTVKAIKKEFPDVNVLIGGAPISEDFAETLNGAATYTANAAEAAKVAKELANR